MSFSYPGSKSEAKALDNVSLTIKAGQLVVVVGQNGSGKSTIVKLLTRLYDTQPGELLIDGRDIQDYGIGDLREAMATLTQEHRLYPLSLLENIGLGNPDQVSDRDAIVDSAKKGGAEVVVSKFVDGLSTILKPSTVLYSVNVRKSDETALAGELRKMQNAIDVSGL